MITPTKENLIRVTVTLDPADVDLLDRMGRLEGLNRSAELRNILTQFRPMFRATVEAFEAALRQRENLDEAMAHASIEQLEAVMPEVERMQNAYLGAMARLEGAAAAAESSEAQDPRPSNHGGQNPQPPSLPDDSETGQADL